MTEMATDSMENLSAALEAYASGNYKGFAIIAMEFDGEECAALAIVSPVVGDDSTVDFVVMPLAILATPKVLPHLTQEGEKLHDL